ncbi:hypothetical protein F753_08415 [Stutzerimonas chloritidismutans AW-1]|uniref:Uncharacterized protein n=1 Tax=Stutzerimonas chloritidismutans AW-1 TaxID=1263865 RepID=V4S3K2_STUCH|nr:hypothetical protein F753_08415 [Stutzerimonas chloritidismutans AW-1]
MKAQFDRVVALLLVIPLDLRQGFDSIQVAIFADQHAVANQKGLAVE